MCFYSLMIKVALAIPWLSAVKTTSELPIYSTGRNTMLQSQAYHDYFQILQNTLIKSIFTCDASVIFHQSKFSRDTNSFAPEPTSCRFSMCSLGQAPNKRKSNSTSTNIVLRHRSSSMRTLSPFLSHLVARFSTPLTPSSTKYVLQQPSLP